VADDYWDAVTISDGGTIASLMLAQTHDFTQIGNPFCGIMSIRGGAPGAYTYTVSAGTMTIRNHESYASFWSVVYGFNVTPKAKANIKAMFGEVQFIPAQSFQYEGLDRIDGNDAVRKSTTVKTNFVEQFDVMFPFHGIDYTVFKNPSLRDFQVQIDNGVNYPEEEVTTYDPRLLRIVHNTSGIGPLALSHDLVASYVVRRNQMTEDRKFVGAPVKNTRYACSDFSIPIDLRRNDNEGAFDGYYSDHNLMSVQVQFQPIVYSTATNEGYNTYYDVDYDLGERNKRPPAPQLFICRHAHWTFQLVGADHNGQPEYSATFETRQLVPGSQASELY
jgi:hypothetical protein